MGKEFYNHIEIVCLGSLNILKMGICMGALKSLGRTLNVHWELEYFTLEENDQVEQKSGFNCDIINVAMTQQWVED